MWCASCTAPGTSTRSSRASNGRPFAHQECSGPRRRQCGGQLTHSLHLVQTGPGHFRSSKLPENRHAYDRFQGYSRHSSTAVRRSSFSKAVAHGIAVPVDIGCRPHVRSSSRRTGAPDTLGEFRAGGTSVSNRMLSEDHPLFRPVTRVRPDCRPGPVSCYVVLVWLIFFKFRRPKFRMASRIETPPGAPPVSLRTIYTLGLRMAFTTGVNQAICQSDLGYRRDRHTARSGSFPRCHKELDRQRGGRHPAASDEASGCTSGT